MKLPSYFYLLPFAFSSIGCSSEKLNNTTVVPLSEQNFEFEIYDSLVVDYLGNLTLMDISPNGKTFLLLDQNTDSILISNSRGELQYAYSRKGGGPGDYSSSRYGIGKFINDQEFILPTTVGLYLYELSGSFQRLYKPQFASLPQVIIPSADNLFFNDGLAYTTLPGRGSDEFGVEGVDFQKKSKLVEVIDLESGIFSPMISFPSNSKFSSTEKAFSFFTLHPNITVKKDSLYLSFRNEPRIYAYALSDLENLASTKTIPFAAFFQKEPKGDKAPSSFAIRDVFVGTINKLIATEDHQFLLDYLSGLSDEQYEKSLENVEGDMNKIWDEALKLNEVGMVLFDGKNISPSITKPVLLGDLGKYISKDEIWFSLNFSEAENDYSVIYKTRLAAKKRI